MTTHVGPDRLSLDQQHARFMENRFMAMPVAGAAVWSVLAVTGAILPLRQAMWAMYVGTGMIFYVGLLVAPLLGEDLLGRSRKGNFFDRIFLLTIVMALLVFGIAIPFVSVEPTSLPLTIGILSGLMWVPFSGLIRHWVGIFHGISRTVLIVLAWYLYPGDRFVAIPIVIVAVYLVSIYVLAKRYSGMAKRVASPSPGRAAA